MKGYSLRVMQVLVICSGVNRIWVTYGGNYTILAVNRISSINRSRATFTACGFRGGLYMLKKKEGDSTENTCDSAAAWAQTDSQQA